MQQELAHDNLQIVSQQDNERNDFLQKLMIASQGTCKSEEIDMQIKCL